MQLIALTTASTTASTMADTNNNGNPPVGLLTEDQIKKETPPGSPSEDNNNYNPSPGLETESPPRPEEGTQPEEGRQLDPFDIDPLDIVANSNLSPGTKQGLSKPPRLQNTAQSAGVVSTLPFTKHKVNALFNAPSASSSPKRTQEIIDLMDSPNAQKPCIPPPPKKLKSSSSNDPATKNDPPNV